MTSDLIAKLRGKLGVLLLAVAVLPFVLFAVPQLAGASHSFVVLSDSMSPQIHAGDVVFVDNVDAAAIEEGNVITFDRPGGDDRVTHRVVDVRESSGTFAFQTKGDANEEPDPQLVPAENVVGRVVFDIPYLGHAVTFIGSDVGLFSFVVVPAFLLVVNELWTLVQAPPSDPDVAGNGGE